MYTIDEKIQSEEKATVALAAQAKGAISFWRHPDFADDVMATVKLPAVDIMQIGINVLYKSVRVLHGDFSLRFNNDVNALAEHICQRLVTFVLFDNDLTLTVFHTWPKKPGYLNLLVDGVPQYARNMRFHAQTAQVINALASKPSIVLGLSTRHTSLEPAMEGLKALAVSHHMAITQTGAKFEALWRATRLDAPQLAGAVNADGVLFYNDKPIGVLEMFLVNDDSPESLWTRDFYVPSLKIIEVNQSDNRHLIMLNRVFDLQLPLSITPFIAALNAETSPVAGMSGSWRRDSAFFSRRSPVSSAGDVETEAPMKCNASSPLRCSQESGKLTKSSSSGSEGISGKISRVSLNASN